jgi:hypothetical protein
MIFFAAMRIFCASDGTPLLEPRTSDPIEIPLDAMENGLRYLLIGLFERNGEQLGGAWLFHRNPN